MGRRRGLRKENVFEENHFLRNIKKKGKGVVVWFWDCLGLCSVFCAVLHTLRTKKVKQTKITYLLHFHHHFRLVEKFDSNNQINPSQLYK